MLEAIKKYLDATVAEIKADAQSKNQSIPDIRVEVSEDGGKAISSDYFKYLVLGRGPGKRPPKDKMKEFVKRHPEMLQDAKTKFKYITEDGLAYIIGKKIGEKGTDIFLGKKPGIDFLGSMDKHMDELLVEIGRGEAVKFITALRTELNGINSQQ